MNKKIYKEIKKYENIIIVRHVNVDPDAMASVMALKRSIELSFPSKKVYAIGTGTIRFNYIGKLDKNVTVNKEKTLLIVLDTPDRKRADFGDFSSYCYSIKIDHHPFIEKFCDLELINEKKSSASEMIYDLINETPLKMDEKTAYMIAVGIVADTGRFLFNNTSSDTFICISNLINKYNLNTQKVYSNLYKRPFNELQLQGYMSLNMKVTENGVGYVKITNDILEKFKVDSASSGDAINEFNNINELLVWLTATEDTRNSYIKVSIRSRGPIINKIAERHGGGGHKLASGVKLPSYEEVDSLILELDKLCLEYIEGCDNDED